MVIIMSKIKVLFMDVDGTLTDGKIYMGDDKEAMKAFSVRDGYGIHRILPVNDIVPVIITNRRSPITLNRCKELGIKHVYQGCSDKADRVCKVAKELFLKVNESGVIGGTAYIGDDIPDISAMRLCEYVGCPGDAADEVKSVAHYICKKSGGDGAVREFVEWLTREIGKNESNGYL